MTKKGDVADFIKRVLRRQAETYCEKLAERIDGLDFRSCIMNAGDRYRQRLERKFIGRVEE